jgi:hypothetical protein
VVVVRVGNKNGDRQALHFVAVGEKIPNQLLARANDTRAGIQENVMVQDIHLHAGGVAADFKCGGTRDRDASPNTPERDCKVVSHSAPLAAKRYIATILTIISKNGGFGNDLGNPRLEAKCFGKGS